MQRVPTSVTVISILGLLFTAYGVFGLLTLAAVFGTGTGFGMPNPVLDKLRDDSTYLTFTGIELAVSLLLMIVLVAGSVGGLKLKPWARPTMLIYAVATIVNGLAGVVFNLVYVMPLMSSVTGPGNAPLGAVVGVSSVCSGLFGMIYPACVLYFYTRPNVVDAFRGIFPPEPERRDHDDYDDRRRYDEEDYDDRRSRPDDEDRFTDRPR